MVYRLMNLPVQFFKDRLESKHETLAIVFDPRHDQLLKNIIYSTEFASTIGSYKGKKVTILIIDKKFRKTIRSFYKEIESAADVDIICVNPENDLIIKKGKEL